jgi:hypothetical protein
MMVLSLDAEPTPEALVDLAATPGVRGRPWLIRLP